MPSQTNEQALESALEKCLTDTCLEEINEQKESTFGEYADLATEERWFQGWEATPQEQKVKFITPSTFFTIQA